ncbi:MAG TPA: response regulator transcription factor [Caulobacteraceae bacterium]|nr:response regulator transcription factor [Caulobacteraceae bacterium]
MLGAGHGRLNAVRVLYATDRRVDGYLVKALREAGHVVETTRQPADALAMAGDGDYRAIVLDWWGTPADGAARFAAAAADPLLVVIASADAPEPAADVLAAGADAVFTRPASFSELEARLEALDRLVSRAGPRPQTATVEMIAAEQAIRVNGRQLTLSGRDYLLMAHLVAHAGEVVSLEQLQQHVWGEEAEPRPDLIRARLSRLRRGLATAGLEVRLRTIAGHGCLFEAPTPR